MSRKRNDVRYIGGVIISWSASQRPHSVSNDNQGADDAQHDATRVIRRSVKRAIDDHECSAADQHPITDALRT